MKEIVKIDEKSKNEQQQFKKEMEKQFEREKTKQYYKSIMELKEKQLKIYYITIKFK